LTQDKLNKQRGVVQNEKRQNDNEPYGLMDYAVGEGLFPVGHPYRHATIGSMADLDKASLDDVRQWFRDHYAPNNVVLTLSGDIDAATARPLVEKYFAAIPRGPQVAKVTAGPVTLPAPARREMVDAVPVTRITRNWSGPGVNDPDSLALEVATRVLGGLASSRLDKALVRAEQLAVSVSAGSQTFEQLSFVQVTLNLKPGMDRSKAEARLDQIIAQFIAEGPSEDELRRAVTGAVSAQISGLEVSGGFGGKGATLAEGQLYSGDPAKYKADLARLAAITTAEVRAAMQRWLTRPAFSVTVSPGKRNERGETMGGWGDEAAVAVREGSPPSPRTQATAITPGPKRFAPPIAPVAELTFPAIEHAKLSNGIPVALARRTAVPKLIVNLAFDAGYAADALDTPGTQGLMLGMLDEGTTSRDAIAIAEEQERLGASISASGSIDQSSITLSALSANLAPSLALMADLARHPAFADKDVARVKDQRQAELAQTLSSPRSLASRTLGQILFGAHPYAQPGDGLGDSQSIAALTPAALRAAHEKWLRPDLASLTVAGDITMAQLLPLLESAFGDWHTSPGPPPTKPLSTPIPCPRPRIVVIDRPDSPQSVIYAGRVLPLTGRTPDMEALDLANEVLGNGFLSRLNLDLREDKGWSYGISSSVRATFGPRTFAIAAPVQADRTGDAIRLLLADIKEFPAAKPVNPQELNRVTDGNIRGLPNSFETNAQVLSGIIRNQLLGRPDNFYATLPSRYRAVDAHAIDAAAQKYLQGNELTFVIVGTRKVIEPQLKGLTLPVEFAVVPDAGG
jgi:zinc protease